MKKISLMISACLFVTSIHAQLPKIYMKNSKVSQDIHGGTISKNDTVDVKVMYDANGNTTVRTVYFDFQHQASAFDLIDVIMATPGANNSAFASGYQFSRDWYEYPGYSWNPTQLNTTSNGNTNYNNQSYTYNQSSPNQITRVYVNSASQIPIGSGEFMTLRFKMNNTQAGYTYDPLKMNFASTYGPYGAVGSEMIDPKQTTFEIDPLSNSLITATVELNGNLDNELRPKLSVYNLDTKIGYLYDISSDGKVNINQSQLAPKNNYRVQIMLPLDKLIDIEKSSITVSDYMAAQNEFVRQNLDGTFSNFNMKSGISYFSADINHDKKFDPTDLSRLFAHVVSVDTLIDVPTGYQIGTNGYISTNTFTSDDFNFLNTTNWNQYNSQPSVLITTTSENQFLNLKYVLDGDINRSHSSQVIVDGVIQTQALSSLKTNVTKMNSVNSFVNTPNNISSIDVTLNNLIVLSNSIEIPINIDTKNNNVSGLQFEVVYDKSKIKFEELKSELPNTWYIFVNSKEGKLRFGAVDNKGKSPIKGTNQPFKIKFSSIGNGLDISSYVKMTSNMDASDNEGNQLGINLNSSTIKLTGYNNFSK